MPMGGSAFTRRSDSPKSTSQGPGAGAPSGAAGLRPPRFARARGGPQHAGVGRRRRLLGGWVDSGGGARPAGLERLLRYCARPPFALERLAPIPGREEAFVYRLPKALPDGKTQLRLTPLELLDRLAVLIPPPRVHRHRYHGVLAPNAPWRAQVTAMAAGTAAQAPSEAAPCLPPGSPAASTQERAAETVHRSYAASLWAMLLARIYEVFPLACPHCGAPMRILAFVTDTASVTRILRHLGEPTQPPRVAPARGPPEWAAPFDSEPGIRPLSGGAGAGLRIRPDPELVKRRNGACPQRERQRSRSSPGNPLPQPPATLLGSARPASGSQIRPADRPPLRRTSPEP